MADMPAPILTALQFAPSVDLSGGPAALDLTLGAEGGVGLDYAVVEFSRGIAGPGTPAAFVFLRAGPGAPWTSGTRTETLTIDPLIGNAPVAVDRVWLWDQAGRSTLYDADAIAAAGGRTVFDVTGATTDQALPVLTGLGLPETLDLSGGGATLEAQVAATDDSGVAAVRLEFDRPLVQPGGAGTALTILHGPGGTFAEGAVSGSLTLTGANGDGALGLAAVHVWDVMGNRQSYEAADLAALGLDAHLTLTGGTPDIAPPELTSLTLPETLALDGEAVLLPYAIAADDASGIAYANLFLDRPLAGPAFDLLSLYLAPDPGAPWTTGMVAREAVVTDATLPGTVGIRSVEIFDIAGNGRAYTGAELAAMGFASRIDIVRDATPGFSLEALPAPGAVTYRLVNAGEPLTGLAFDAGFAIDAPQAGLVSAELARAGTLTFGGQNLNGIDYLDLAGQVAGTRAIGPGAPVLEIVVPLPEGGTSDLWLRTLSLSGQADPDFALAPPPVAVGTAGADALAARPAGTELHGFAGDDTLSGGPGDDTLTGGAGADTFAFGPGGGADRIADFSEGEDRLDLRAFDRAEALAALSVAGPGPARLTFADGTQIVLDGLTQEALGPEDARLAPPLPPPPDLPSGAVWSAQRITLGPEPLTVTLPYRFADPVAFAQTTTEAGSLPVVARILDTSATAVTLALERPAYLAGAPAEEDVTLLVVEAGTHRLADGTLVQAGLVETALTTAQGFAPVSYAEAFANRPQVMSQAQTESAPGFLSTRLAGDDETGLRLALEAVEAENGALRPAETVGWLAVEAGTGWAAAPGAGLARFEAGTTGLAVADGPGRHAFAAAFAEAPALAAAQASFAGPDPGVLRISSLDAEGFDARIQEDQSLDAETGHTAERVDFLAHALPDGIGAAAGDPLSQIGEVHRLTVSGGAQNVALSRSYDTPVIVAQGASFNGADPATVRITEVTGDSVRLRMQEPNYLDDLHANEDVTLLVLEAGVHELADGRRIEAGLWETGRLTSAGFDPVRFEMGFDAPPVLLSTVMTNAGADFVVTRHDAVDGRGFRIAMQEEEALNGGGHMRETIGWVAVEPGGGAWSGLAVEAGRAEGVTDGGARHDFATPFDAAPGLVASLATFRGADPAMPRLPGVDLAGFTARAQEEASLDAETGHTSEALDYLAIGGAGALSGFTRDPVIAEAGTVEITHAGATIALSHRFDDPVVFAAATTANGGQPATVRIAALTDDSLTLALDEPLSADGLHAFESVSWLVVEAGAWALADGTRLEAGTAEVAARGPAGLTEVAFAAPFDATPVTLTMAQSVPDRAFLDTRQEGADAAGLSVTLEAEEARNAAPQPPQEIGWLAIEPGTGFWEGADGGIVFEAARTGLRIADGPVPVAFDAPFAAPPLLLSDMATYEGPDPGIVRAQGLDAAGVELRIQEDESLDAETGHTAEDVALLGLSGGGLLLGEVWAA